MTGRMKVVLRAGFQAAALSLAGCASAPAVAPATVKVPVVMPCPVDVPRRPTMPVEALPTDADLWQIGTALWAERAVREGYEIELRTRLEGCVRGD